MVYDCFIFFNELDLLEIRLNTLKDVVDRFVIVESENTFQGKPKPLYFEENKVRFKSFEDRIIHVVMRNVNGNDSLTEWQRESAQRNELLSIWKKCKPNDTIILSDADEIPNPDLIRKNASKPGVTVFQHRNFYHYLNCRCMSISETWWYGSVMFSAKNLKEPQKIRMIAANLNRSYNLILKKVLRQFISFMESLWIGKRIAQDAGWHFGFLGGEEMIIQKIEAFSHTEYNQGQYKDINKIKTLINSGTDLFGRDLTYEFVRMDATFPKFILCNIDRYKHLIKSGSN